VFLDVPVRHIDNVLREQKTFYKAYGVIDEQLHNYKKTGRRTVFVKIGKPRLKRATEVRLIGCGSAIPKELHAAKKKSEKDFGKYLKSRGRHAVERTLTGWLHFPQCNTGRMSTSLILVMYLGLTIANSQ
jgi:TRIAD3 protein (E3 ubiquitin-protein ligase RNF216)